MTARSTLAKTWPSLLLVMAVLLSATFLYRICYCRDDIRFLGGAKAGRWILYPSPLCLMTCEVVPLDTEFRRSFRLDEIPKSAALTLRAFKRFTMQINGVSVPVSCDPRSWKKEIHLDITKYVRAGENAIAVVVTNECGPPALWLNLVCDDKPTLVSDEKWESSLTGATWLPVALASGAVPLGDLDPTGASEDCLTALLVVWPSWLLFGVLATGAVVCGWLSLRIKERRLAPADRPNRVMSGWPRSFREVLLFVFPSDQRRQWEVLTIGVFGAIAVVWVALLTHNSKYLPTAVGFDAQGHLEYIGHFLTSSTVPMPGDGWQTHHPPLYHFLAASVLSWFHQVPSTASGLLTLRLFNAVIGISTLGILLLSLRLVFPEHPRRWLLGLLVAGFLPMSIYLHHYPSNHVLGAMLASLSVYLTLRILYLPARMRDYVYLGIALGLALLCVVSVVVLILPIGAAVVAKAYVDRHRINWSQSLCQLLLLGALTAGECGWYYLSVWHRFGTPFVANVGAKEGSPRLWWQQPGYRTEDDFLRFGMSLSAPMFSARYSVWDGFYSTLWGDSFGGGAAHMDFRPPWSYNHIAAGMLLAMLPTIATILACAAVLTQWLRKPTFVWAFLLGVLFLVGFLLVYTAILVPYVSTPKAFYGFAAIIPACIILAYGLDQAAKYSRLAISVLFGFLILFCCNVVASYWIPAGSVDAQEWIALQLQAQGQYVEAIQAYEQILAEHPESTRTRVRLARACIGQNLPEQALAVLQLPAGAYDLPSRHYLLAMLLLRDERRRQTSFEELRVAAEAAPDDIEIGQAFALAVASQSDLQTAITAYRNLLRIMPYSDGLHEKLATLYRETGDMTMAKQHDQWALRLRSSQTAK